MEIPELTGLKHSSLDRVKELERLALRDEMRPEFTIYTGNDLAINMIESAPITYSASRPLLLKNLPSATVFGKPAIQPTTRSPTHCNTSVR